MWLISGFIGFSIGVALQRFLICSSVNSFTPTVCELCQWQEKRKERRKRRKAATDCDEHAEQRGKRKFDR